MQSLLEPTESAYILNSKQDACAICLENFKQEEILLNLPSCEHSFHKTCLDKWLQYKKICPLCRNES